MAKVDGEAQFNMAVAHVNGVGVAADANEAYRWLLVAAAARNADAAGAE